MRVSHNGHLLEHYNIMEFLKGKNTPYRSGIMIVLN
jgi:hypothetical protein